MTEREAVDLFEEFNGYEPRRVAVAKVSSAPRGVPRRWVRLGDVERLQNGKRVKFPKGTALYASRSNGKTMLALNGPWLKSAKGRSPVSSICYFAKPSRYKALGLGNTRKPFRHVFGKGVKARGVVFTQGKREVSMILISGGRLAVDRRGVLN